jgi:hypothetical protein
LCGGSGSVGVETGGGGVGALGAFGVFDLGGGFFVEGGGVAGADVASASLSASAAIWSTTLHIVRLRSSQRACSAWYVFPEMLTCPLSLIGVPF